MLSHPLTFLVGYIAVSVLLSCGVIGPLVALGVQALPRRRFDRRHQTGLWVGASVTSFGFMVLHYLLYLRGHGVTDWSALWGDIFYPPQVF
ncbi:MAG: hypothetical protein L0Y36_07085 [Planctomycetales bacterium]|nr:hypothetical protein [Planctomycetales bacterium]